MASAEVGVFVGGRGKFVHFQKDTLTPNFAYHYSWDGRDAFGREMQGRQAATVIVSHQYNPPYADPDTSAQAILFATYPSGSQVSTSRDADQYSVSWTYDVPVGQLKDPPASLGGWLVSEHMHYDVGGRRLLTGYGEEIAVDALTGTTVPRTVEKYTNYANDNSRLTPLAVGANGEVYLVEPSDNGRIKRLNPDGSLTRISGTHNGGITDQDGAPASTAFVGYNLGLAVAPDGSLLYADRDSHRVRRITPDGVVHTIAGKVGAPTFVSGGVQFYDPSSGYTGDGGPASAATLCSPTAVTAAPDGTIYIWDSGNNVIRRVNSAGMISTVVGTGAPGYGGARPADGLPGRQVSIYQSGTSSNHLAVSPDGSVYFDSHYQYTVLSRLGTDGRVHYVTGDIAVPSNTPQPELVEGLPAATSASHAYDGFGIDAKGRVYFADHYHYAGDQDANSNLLVGPRIREISNSGFVHTVAGNGTHGDSNEYHEPALRSHIVVVNTPTVAPDNSLVFGGTEGIDRLKTFPVLAEPGCTYSVPSSDAAQVFCFDADGRHLKTLDAKTRQAIYTFGYTANLLSSITDANNNITTITRDGVAGTIEIKAPFGQKTKINTDSVTGYANKITFPDATTVTPEHQPNGLLTKLVDARSFIHNFQYDALGLLKRDENPAGGYQTLSRSGDTVTRTTALGRKSLYTTTTTATDIQTGVSRAPDGTETTTLQRPDLTTRTTYPDGSKVDTVLEPDPIFGEAALYEQARTVTLPSGLQRKSTVSREAVPSSTGGVQSLTVTTNSGKGDATGVFDGSDPDNLSYTLTSAAGRQTTYLVDAQGRAKKILIPGLSDISFDYDTAGRPWHTTRGTRVRTTTYLDDPQAAGNGYLSTVKLANDASVTFERDAFGRPKSLTDPQLRKLRFGYDLSGNVASLELPKSVGASVHVYHSLQSGATDLLAKYTPPVLPPTLPTAADVTTTFLMDDDQAPAKVVRPGGIEVTFEHDGVTGKLSSISGPNGTTHVEYYPQSPCGSGCSAGSLHSLTGPTGETETLTYDGPLVKSVTFGGSVTGSIGYDYGSGFRIQAETVTVGNSSSKVSLAFDSDDLLTCSSLSSCAAQDTSALRLSRASDNPLLGGSTLGKIYDAYGHNEYGELATVASSFADTPTTSTPLFSVTYDDPTTVTRDQLGRVVRQTETVLGEQHTTIFRYYDAGWLKAVERDGIQTASYLYDDNGNRLTKTTPATGDIQASYDDQDRLQSYGSATFDYTPNGELKQKTVGTAITKYFYDEYGGLSKVILPNNDSVSYVVDPSGRRIQRTAGSQRTQWIYSGSRIVAELDNNGTVVSRFLYGSRSNSPDAVVKYSGATTKTYRIISDQAGSPRLIVNVADKNDHPLVASYDEFGVVSGTGLGFVPFGFAGGIYDSDTRLIRFGARDYDPELGRWLAKDPVLFRGDQPNLYLYVGNDPVNRRDPLGNWGIAIGGSGGLGFGFPLGGSQDLGSGVVISFDSTGITVAGYTNHTTSIGAGAYLGFGFDLTGFTGDLKDFAGTSFGGKVDVGLIEEAQFKASNIFTKILAKTCGGLGGVSGSSSWSATASAGYGGGLYVGGTMSTTAVEGYNLTSGTLVSY